MTPKIICFLTGVCSDCSWNKKPTVHYWCSLHGTKLWLYTCPSFQRESTVIHQTGSWVKTTECRSVTDGCYKRTRHRTENSYDTKLKNTTPKTTNSFYSTLATTTQDKGRGHISSTGWTSTTLQKTSGVPFLSNIQGRFFIDTSAQLRC